MIAHFKNEFVSLEELYTAYLDCRKRKRRTLNSCSFELDGFQKLYELWFDLNSKRYQIGRSITFIVDRPVKREVFAADFRDRIVHHLLINRIIHLLEKEFIDDSYSCRVGKGTEYAVQRCKMHIEQCSENYTKETFIYKADLKSFFMTIDKTKLYNKLISFYKEKGNFSEKDYEFNCWLTKLIIFNEPQNNCILKQKKRRWDDLPKNKSLFNCDSNHGLPIGNLTSQLFANFYLSWFDHWVTEEMGFIHYGRYVDDFYIVDNDKEKILNFVSVIKDKLAENGVTLHPKKFYLQEVKKGVKFVGSVIKQNRIYIAKRTVGNLHNAVKEMNYFLTKYEGNRDIIQHCCCVMNSYLGFLRHKKTFNIRKKVVKWPDLQILWKYCYYNKNITKVTVYADYCIKGSNLKKHDVKEYNELYKNKETRGLANWLSSTGYFDNIKDKNNNISY